MKLGITGTREGCNAAQLETLFNLISEIAPHCTEFHHGDCTGVDIQAATIAQELGIRTISHPPIYNTYRAWHASDVILEPMDYIPRDHKIVESVDLMIVIPLPAPGRSRGTWATHRYAVKLGVPRLLVDGDGNTERQQ